MLHAHRSPAKINNPSLKRAPRASGQDNAAYIGAHVSRAPEVTNLVLLGGVGPLDFRLRAAQAHLRDDMSPSAWSHALLLDHTTEKLTGFEASLYGRAGVGYPPSSNGLSAVDLVNDYADVRRFPNVAVLHIPVALAEVLELIEQFKTYRSTVDLLGHQLTWWGYAWGVGKAGNPLLGGVGIPAAVFAEYVLGAAGYDLVPSLPSRSSSPEGIWLSARWWFEMPRIAAQQPDTEKASRAIVGYYDAEHYLVPPS